MTFRPEFIKGVREAAALNELEIEEEESTGRCYVFVDGYNPIVITDLSDNLASAQIVLEDLNEVPDFEPGTAFDIIKKLSSGMGYFSVGLVEDRYLTYSFPVHDYGRFVDALMECCLADDCYDRLLGKEVPESRLE